MVSTRSQGRFRGCIADVAQLVEHHLAKVRVAGSNPVVRSKGLLVGVCSVEWPRGEATACKAVYTGSNPVSTSGNTGGPTWPDAHQLASGLAIPGSTTENRELPSMRLTPIA